MKQVGHNFAVRNDKNDLYEFEKTTAKSYSDSHRCMLGQYGGGHSERKDI